MEKITAFVRPIVTILLTLGFIFIVSSPIYSGVSTDIWKDMVPVYTGVYGVVVGYLFGGREASKK